MKLNDLIPQHLPGKLIRRFGDAWLVRHGNGRHELIGGSRADRLAAAEWTSLFAHEVVFTQRPHTPVREAGGRWRQQPRAAKLLPAI